MPRIALSPVLHSLLRRLRSCLATPSVLVLQLLNSDFIFHTPLGEQLTALKDVYLTKVCFQCWELLPQSGAWLLHNHQPLHAQLHSDCPCTIQTQRLPKGLAVEYAAVVEAYFTSNLANVPPQSPTVLSTLGFTVNCNKQPNVLTTPRPATTHLQLSVPSRRTLLH